MISTGRPLSLIELDFTVSSPAAIPDRVYATIKHRVLTCAMLPGHRVVEKDLCAEMGISRTPLRPLYLGLDVGIDAKASTVEHVEVVSAVRNHDPDRARALMLLHIGRAETRVVNALHAADY